MSPPGPADERFANLYRFAAYRPGTDQAGAPAPPEATNRTIHLFLAGGHGGRLVVPGNITLLPRPAYGPDLNPVEQVRLYPRERCPSQRVLRDFGAALDAARSAWNRLAAQTGRLASLNAYPDLLGLELR